MHHSAHEMSQTSIFATHTPNSPTRNSIPNTGRKKTTVFSQWRNNTKFNMKCARKCTYSPKSRTSALWNIFQECNMKLASGTMIWSVFSATSHLNSYRNSSGASQQEKKKPCRVLLNNWRLGTFKKKMWLRHNPSLLRLRDPNWRRYLHLFFKLCVR